MNEDTTTDRVVAVRKIGRWETLWLLCRVGAADVAIKLALAVLIELLSRLLRRITPAMRLALCIAVCTFVLSACASNPQKLAPVPPELVPAGFSAADCHITDPGGPITDNNGPNGTARNVGTRAPKVACTKKEGETVNTTSAPTCHTQGGKVLPVSDCCMNPDGSKIQGCTPKLQPPGE